MTFKPFITCILLLTVMSCLKSRESEPQFEKSLTKPARKLAKFEPEDGKVLLFVGQELAAIGGLENYNDGYLDHFDRPAGFTMYTNFSPGDSSFGHVNKGLDGVNTTDNWGDGPSNMAMQLSDPDFKNMALAIGLAFVNHEAQVANGEHDDLIVGLAEFIKKQGERPVFLRVGYEFDGHQWNHYDKENYIKSFRHIHDVFDSLEVNNVAFVWQSTGWASSLDHLEAWYPGDDYVDWCAYSFFARFDEAKMIEFARQKGKPVFIAEATPTIGDETIKFDGQTIATDLSDAKQAKVAWEKWFIPLFKTIRDNPDEVKAVSYINSYWKSQPMWKDNPTFQKIDARLQKSSLITKKWREETSKKTFILSSDTLYQYMNKTH